MRRSIPFILAVATSVVPAGATASIAPAPLATEASGRASALWTALDTGRLAPAVASLLHAPAPVVAAPVGSAAEAVAHLSAAIAEARGMLGPLRASEVRAALGAGAKVLLDWQRATAAAGEPAEGRPGHAPKPQAPPVVQPELAGVSPAVARAIAAAPRAAALIAAAIDRALPALRAAAPPATGLEAAPCDVLDRSPYVCVSSAGDTTYTQSAALIVDQGGTDIYRNSAAGAPFVPAGGGSAIPVSVILDQGGNDTYAPEVPTAQTTIGGFTYNVRVAGASGAAGGIGILVDDAGDDTHVATAPDVTQKNRYGFAAFQGAAMGGVGILMDRAGSDRYTATAPAGTGNGISFVAQGAAIMTYRTTSGPDAPPLGALLDLGTGSDAYTMDAGTVSSVDGAGFRGALGQGYTLLGSGALADEGGTDRIEATAAARWEGRDTYPDHTGSWLAPSATVLGQGYGLGPVAGNTYAPKGVALLLQRGGDTSYELRADGIGMVDTDVWGQGFAGGDGAALVQDEAGADRYLAASHLSLERTIAVGDGCGCDRAEASVSATRLLFASTLLAQGVGGVTGEGILRDLAGDDVYTAVADATLRVRLEDRLTAPAGPASLRARGYGPLWTGAQGYAGLGQGLLLDHSGTDHYTLRNATDVRAESASASSAPGEPEAVAIAGQKGNAKGQGGGEWILGSTQLAAIVDRAGENDRFLAEATNTASAAPDPSLAFTPGWYWPQGFQGNGFEGLFIAEGTSPQIVSRPAQGVCPTSPGPRGSAHWTYCGVQGTDAAHQVFDGLPAFIAPLANVWAAGRAPRATSVSPQLSFLPGTASQGSVDGAVPVEAKLTRTDGSPVAGAAVRFDLQTFYPGTGGLTAFGVYLNAFEVQAVTSADGIARASLPLAYSRLGLVPPATAPLRLLATFDGMDGLLSAHATSSFALS